jgi:hypothetical protein
MPHSMYNHSKVILSCCYDAHGVSAGLTTSGFDELDKDTPYLYISNHCDIKSIRRS